MSNTFESENDHKEANFCMESRKRKHALMDLSSNESWIPTGTFVEILPPNKLPRLEDVSEVKIKLLPKEKSIITEDATGNNRGKNLNIKIKSASLADSFTPSQIKEHLSSFVHHKVCHIHIIFVDIDRYMK